MNNLDIDDGLLPGQVRFPRTLEEFRTNAQLAANHERQTMYVYEVNDPKAKGFDRWLFSDRPSRADATLVSVVHPQEAL